MSKIIYDLAMLHKNGLIVKQNYSSTFLPRVGETIIFEEKRLTLVVVDVIHNMEHGNTRVSTVVKE